MALWPQPGEAVPPFDLVRIEREVAAFARDALAPWEAGYLEYHARRYQDTLRLLPEGRRGGRRLAWIGSVEGGLEEFDESCPSRASSAATRRSRDCTTARTAACTSGGVLSQSSWGIGGVRLMPPL